MSINCCKNVNKFLLLKTKQFSNQEQTAFTQFPWTKKQTLSFQQKVQMEILFAIIMPKNKIILHVAIAPLNTHLPDEKYLLGDLQVE